MYVFDDNYIEVIYKAENFRHLTGVDTNLSARQFYNYATKGKLEASQIWFSSKHPYELCERKMQHIIDIASLAETECFLLEEIQTDTMTYRFGTTDLNFTLCLDKDTDSDGLEKSECFVVHSLRDGDCFSKSKEAYVVSHIFSRQNDKKKYTDLLYMDDSSSLDSLPIQIRKMLEGDFNEC
ncbi:MAG: PBECR4 domain-containing protein [Lachnospiraceae bacterium]|nr:PBECR4 domain-containing protein [Lachnospiraceae bacterium]